MLVLAIFHNVRMRRDILVNKVFATNQMTGNLNRKGERELSPRCHRFWNIILHNMCH